MRFSPLVSPHTPARRVPFGRRFTAIESPAPAGPTTAERRLIDRLLHRAGYRDSR